MIQNDFEMNYKHLIDKIMTVGDLRETRNGNTKSLFAESLSFDLDQGFPLLTGRKMHYKGVMGELAAMLRQPKNLKDFVDQGCNYWTKWSNPDGTLTLDYGNAWLDYEGVNQLQNVLDSLVDNPHDRRMVISGWRPDRLDELSLPCCHFAYQFYVRDGMYLDMMWMQRSADTMIGIPSDAIFAASWIIAMGTEVGLIPGRVTMHFGDVHVYEEHVGSTIEYMHSKIYDAPKFTHIRDGGHKTVDFINTDIKIKEYRHGEAISFELKE